MKLEAELGVICFFGFFFSFLCVICIILRKVMGVSWSVELAPSPPLRKSWWGDASVNSVLCRGMVQVVEYETGWLVRVLPTFVFGVLWLPKQGTEVGDRQPGGWFVSAQRRLDHESDVVILFGHLADFVSPASDSTMDRTAPGQPS